MLHETAPPLAPASEPEEAAPEPGEEGSREEPAPGWTGSE